MNPSGSQSRITNGPSLAGSPSRTENFAPDGSDPGPVFHTMLPGEKNPVSGTSSVFFSPPACPAGICWAETEAATITSENIKRDFLSTCGDLQFDLRILLKPKRTNT